MKLPHAGEPITEDDAKIAAYLEDVSIPTLLVSMVHLTGDPSWIRSELKPQGLFLNEIQGFMSEDDKAEARRRALVAIATFRDGGCVLPPPPDAELVREMMAFLACEPVPDNYVELMLEELELDGIDHRRIEIDAPDDAKRAFPVLVIGCGQSGLLAGIRLKEMGLPFTILEKNASLGGTWWENQYPGCRVDVGNHFYCYSFEPSDHWSEYFAQQPELHQYFVDVMHRHGIDEHVRWETEVVRAEWDDVSASWVVTARTPDGNEEVLRARALISAVGQLNRPSLPDIPGMETFAGPSFHSAGWDHSVDHRGKRVALIGAGASGFQIAPTIAPEVEQLTVFQRTAQWMFPNPNYHAKVGEGMRWALRHLPYYGRWYRFLIFWPASGRTLEFSRIDPDYPDQQRAVSEANELTRQFFTGWIESQVEDPELLAKVVPDYPATGKRTLQDNGSWLQALQRENVMLVRNGIDHIEPDAVVTVDGTRHHVDLIVYATGFHVNKFLWPMDIVGRNGVVLAEQWDGGEDAAAYLGITVPNFPNFFCLYGPGTNLAHGGSLIFHSECEMRYISGCLGALVANGHRSMDVRADVYDAYEARHQSEINQMVWASPAIRHNFYRNGKGVIRTLSPWPLADFWEWTREPDLAEYVFDDG
ncbi:MAG: NAD(P)/FAD-dependent oxidoreductase [Acidimicrobiia bacterium]